MHRQLAICGYEVTAAVRGEDAVNAYRQAREAGRPFDAVILDLLVAAGWGGERTLVELPEARSGGQGAGLQRARWPGPAAEHYERKGFRGCIEQAVRRCAETCAGLEAALQDDVRVSAPPVAAR